MLAKLRRRMQDEQGFTLIELLVVILIIGILAAIAIPAFLNQRSKAYDAAAKSNITTARTAEESYATDNNGSYVAATTSTAGGDALTSVEPSLKSAPFVTAVISTGGYTLTSQSAGPAGAGTNYTLVNNAGSVTRSCSPAGSGGCSTSGSW